MVTELGGSTFPPWGVPPAVWLGGADHRSVVLLDPTAWCLTLPTRKPHFGTASPTSPSFAGRERKRRHRGRLRAR